MIEIKRFHTRTKTDKLEALTGIRTVASIYVVRPGQKPLFVRADVSTLNR